MKTLNNISSAQYADDLFGKIDQNFTDVKSAIDALEQSGGGSGGGETPSKGYINILAVGNSFTQCMMMHIAKICENLGITQSTGVNVQHIYNAGTSLQYYVEQLSTTRVHSLTTDVNGGHLLTNGTFSQILTRPWDIIVFQQVSGDSDNYATYEPYLSQLVEAVQRFCPNKNVEIAWHMTWQTGAAAYSDIVNSVKQMLDNYGHIIKRIIPNGTSVENIRGTSLNANKAARNFTYDFNTATGNGQHLHVGVGDFVAGCTFYQSLIYPFTGIDIRNSTLTITAENNTDYVNAKNRWENTYSGSSAGAVEVTDANRDTCLKSVLYALIHPFGATDIDNV